MKEEKYLVRSQKLLLEKFTGKGGWTYVRIEPADTEKKLPFGMIRVSGSIDNIKISNAHLMPMGQHRMFLPVKADIRKKLKKNAGDWVTIALYVDDQPLEIPGELIECLKDEPIAYQNFMRFTESEKKGYVDYIYKAKTDDVKVDRIATAINNIAKGKMLKKNK